MTLRHHRSSESRHHRAVRALGGVRAAQHAEQMRACGLDRDRVAARLGVPTAALDDYYALQDERASTVSPGQRSGVEHSTHAQPTRSHRAQAAR